MRRARLRRSAVCLAAALFVGVGTFASAEERWRDRLVDPEDGAFDASRYLLDYRGFLPVPILVTEPALGYGAGLAALWFSESIAEASRSGAAEAGRLRPPTIGGLGAFKTENGSWGGFAGYFAPLAGDRFRYVGGVGKVHLDLDYYALSGQSVAYTLDGVGLVQQLIARAGSSDWFVGPRYVYLTTESRFQSSRPGDVSTRDLDVRIGRLSLVVDYDSRDNIFTPNRGTYFEGELATAREALGGTVEFDSASARIFHYVPFGSQWVLGLRGDARVTSADTPFFLKPYVSLRGVPALRYQDDRAVMAETELRWNLTPRWALIGFIGAGKAYGGRTSWSEAETVVAKGFGGRYLVARQLGLYAGLDFAWGPEDFAFYLQVGSAWR